MNKRTGYLEVGRDLRYGEAKKLARWWGNRPFKPVGGIIVTLAPTRSTRGHLVYDVYLRRQKGAAAR